MARGNVNAHKPCSLCAAKVSVSWRSWLEHLLGLIRGCVSQVLAVSTSEPARAGHGSFEAHGASKCSSHFQSWKTERSNRAKAGMKRIFTLWQTKSEIENLCTSVLGWWRAELRGSKHGLNFLPVHFLFAYFFFPLAFPSDFRLYGCFFPRSWSESMAHGFLTL